ncbi:unnamed protein product [Caenorhabditis sp. 36 PRJEB53466]|nr:unnamed protein product [Caenorhabditis sp. 36 PRJEB53466]
MQPEQSALAANSSTLKRKKEDADDDSTLKKKKEDADDGSTLKKKKEDADDDSTLKKKKEDADDGSTLKKKKEDADDDSTLKKKKEDADDDSTPPAKLPREETIMNWTTAETCDWLAAKLPPHSEKFIEVLRKNELKADKLMVVKDNPRHELIKRIPELEGFYWLLFKAALKLEVVGMPKTPKHVFH